MPTFQVAHIKQQGVNLIIIPLDSSFGSKVTSDQHAIVAQLQARARSAGMAGTVVPAWDSGGGRFAFLAPRNWHSFFESLTLETVARNINKKLFW
jgi:hypothetical protein